MPIATATAILLGSLISALIGAATSVGLTVGTQAYEDSLRDKANNNKATYADVQRLLDNLTTKAKSLSQTAQSRLANKLNSIFANPAYSSGLSESLMSNLRSRVKAAKSEAEKHFNLASAYEQSAENQASALSGMSNAERAKAKKEDGSWDLDTVAGRTGAEVDRLGELAKDEYDKAKALGEKYA